MSEEPKKEKPKVIVLNQRRVRVDVNNQDNNKLGWLPSDYKKCSCC
jgi:hypothetical protein